MEFISLKQFEWLAHNLFGEYDASHVYPHEQSS